MKLSTLYPLRFRPLFKTALWGGTRLRPRLSGTEDLSPTGEAWILSDQGDSLSVIADGPLAGTTFRQLLEVAPERILGYRPANGRFPLLLKFLDARQPLSIQVHPNDVQAKSLDPNGPGTGKTEAWVVLEAEPEAKLYCGLRDGTTQRAFEVAIRQGTAETLIFTQHPNPGECFFLPAGTVHAIGAGLLLFEIQQSSDITYRLSDWGRVDPQTGKPRELHIEQGLACIDYQRGPVLPIEQTDDGLRKIRMSKLVACDHFALGRWNQANPFKAGKAGKCRVLIVESGRGVLQHAGIDYPLKPMDLLLLPAEVGACDVIPHGGEPVAILECLLPEPR
jgi:mannose-6-phosphate isomerase